MVTQRFEGVIATTPRVGQNAILSSIRGAYPNAHEYGKARPDYPPLHFPGGVLIYSTGSPTEVDLDADVDRKIVRIGRCDVIAQAVSWAYAEDTGRYLSTDEQPEIEPVYNAMKIRGFLQRILDDEAYWAEFLSTWYDREDITALVYEVDIETDPVAAAQFVLDHFGLPYAEPLPAPEFTTFDRDIKAEWTQRFKNGHIGVELRERIQAHEFEWCE